DEHPCLERLRLRTDRLRRMATRRPHIPRRPHLLISRGSMTMSTLTAALAAFPIRRALRALLALMVCVLVLLPMVSLAEETSGAQDDRDSRVTDDMFAPAASASTSTAPEPDGLNEGTAAASCWEIKQRDPASE